MAFKRSSVRFRLAPPNSLFPTLGFAAFVLVGCQSAPEPAPAPEPQPIAPATASAPDGAAVLDPSVRVMPPGEGIPAKYVAFSGIWGGRLDGMYDGKLAVLTISRGGNVTATYAWGDIADNKPGVADGEGKIFGNTLKLRRLPNGGDVSAVMQADGTLTVTYGLADRTYTGTFTKQ